MATITFEVLRDEALDQINSVDLYKFQNKISLFLVSIQIHCLT
jgi:hypothetical protein